GGDTFLDSIDPRPDSSRRAVETHGIIRRIARTRVGNPAVRRRIHHARGGASKVKGRAQRHECRAPHSVTSSGAVGEVAVLRDRFDGVVPGNSFAERAGSGVSGWGRGGGGGGGQGRG